MSGASIVVAGAGAVGGTIAFVLARAGHRVTVVDPAPVVANASVVAAGMLAPAFESLFDAEAGADFALLAAARDLWPDLAAEIGLPLAREGALAIGSWAEALAWTDTLAKAGANARTAAPDEVADRVRGLPAGSWAVFSPDDWRLDPRAALARLQQAAEGHGARFVRGQVRGYEAGKAEVGGLGRIAAECLVLATGAARDLADLAPELAVLTPIKGHILRAAGNFTTGPVVREPGVYLCRANGEAILGATMEPGVADASVDPTQVSRLLASARHLTASLGPLAWRAAAGVRAATPDGLPLVGEGRAANIILAVGARRNGWLLAPMIARTVLDVFEGRQRDAAGARLEPTRLRLTAPG
jgi:glycine oxidase